MIKLKLMNEINNELKNYKKNFRSLKELNLSRARGIFLKIKTLRLKNKEIKKILMKWFEKSISIYSSITSQ